MLAGQKTGNASSCSTLVGRSPVNCVFASRGNRPCQLFSKDWQDCRWTSETKLRRVDEQRQRATKMGQEVGRVARRKIVKRVISAPWHNVVCHSSGPVGADVLLDIMLISAKTWRAPGPFRCNAQHRRSRARKRCMSRRRGIRSRSRKWRMYAKRWCRKT